jgi:hypothetical protein
LKEVERGAEVASGVSSWTVRRSEKRSIFMRCIGE